MDTNVTITCTKCIKQFTLNTDDFEVKIVGVLQLKCKDCGQVKTLPDSNQVWGLEQGEKVENQVARLTNVL